MQCYFHASNDFARMGKHVENESFLTKLYHFRECSRLCHWKRCSVNITQQIIPKRSMHAHTKRGQELSWKWGGKNTQYKQIHSSHTAGLQCPPLYWTKGKFWAQQWVSVWLSDLTDFIKSDAYLFIWQINPNLRSPWLKRCKMNDQNFHLDYPEERAAVFIQEVVATFVWSLSFYAVYSLHSVMLELQYVMFLL